MLSKIKLFTVIFSVIALSIGFNAKSRAAEVKIALVDMVQIVKNYDQAKKAQIDLQINQKKLNEMIVEAREEVRKIKEEKAKEAKEKVLSEKILTKSKTYREQFSKEWQKVQTDILLTIKKVADNGKYDLVMDKQNVIAGGKDITREVLAELEK